jgi:DUF4097 and DUF4098 domain-containing protein YvlB
MIRRWCVKKNLACSLAFLFVVAVTSARADDWSKSYPVTGKPDVRVDVEDGNVDVISSSGKQVHATVVTRGWKIDADGVRILEEQSGNHVQIEIKVPHNHINFGNHSVKVELTVPAEADLDLHTGDGNLTADGVKGRLRFSTGDGNIDAHSLDGPLFARTGDGNLKLEGRFDDLEAATGDGDVQVEAASGSRMGTGWSLHTGDGNVTLRCADDLSADLDAHTGDGKIRLDFPITTSGSLKENTVEGRINGGGATLKLRTGDGDIRIEKL